MDLDSLETCVKRHLRTLVLSPVAEDSAQRTEHICRVAAGLNFAETRCEDSALLASPSSPLDSTRRELNPRSPDSLAVQELLEELADPCTHSPDSRWQVSAMLCLDLLVFQKRGEGLDAKKLAFVGREFFQLFLEELPHVISVVQVAQEILKFSARVPAWRLSLLWFIWQSLRALRLQRKVFGIVELAAVFRENLVQWPWMSAFANSTLPAERKDSISQNHSWTAASRRYNDAMEGLVHQVMGEVDDAIRDMPQIKQELQLLRDALANRVQSDSLLPASFLEGEDDQLKCE